MKEKTVNRSAYNKEYKRHVCNETGKCPYCKYHSGIDNTKHGGGDKKTWKRKRKTQYDS